jgi:hypothetical protein
MKKLLALAILFVAIAGHAQDSPLVKAAKANGGPKKKTTKKAITNADVKKSAVKSSAPATGAKAAPKVQTPPVPMPPVIADQSKLIHARADAQKRADDAQVKVNDLDKELDRLEQSYYAENDPNYRDKTIAPHFEQTKLQLETARKELADARDALEKLLPKPQ